MQWRPVHTCPLLSTLSTVTKLWVVDQWWASHKSVAVPPGWVASLVPGYFGYFGGVHWPSTARMDQLFGSLKSLIKHSNVVIDNHIFRLHYRATVVILIAFSLMVTGMSGLSWALLPPLSSTSEWPMILELSQYSQSATSRAFMFLWFRPLNPLARLKTLLTSTRS